MLLQNLPPMNFQMPLFTVMATYTALLLTWELILQEVKYQIGSCLYNLLILSCPPSLRHRWPDIVIKKKSHSKKCLFWILRYSTSWVAALCRLELCSVSYSTCSESVIDSLIQYSVVSSKVRNPRSMNDILEMGIAFLSVIFRHPPPDIFLLLPLKLWFLLLRALLCSISSTSSLMPVIFDFFMWQAAFFFGY